MNSVINRYFNLPELDSFEKLTRCHNGSSIHNIWLFNIGSEKEWREKEERKFIGADEDLIVNCIEELNLLLCSKNDGLIIRKKPDKEFLEYIQNLGFYIPKLFILSSKDLLSPIIQLLHNSYEIISGICEFIENTKKVYQLVPYGVTASVEQFANDIKLDILGSDSKTAAKVNNKIFSRELAESLGFAVPSGSVCISNAEIIATFENLMASGFKRVIIKEPNNASGKGLYIVSGENELKRLLDLFERLGLQNDWLVEGWYDKRTDLNYQVMVRDDKVLPFSIKKQWIEGTVYRGSIISPTWEGNQNNKFFQYALDVGNALKELNYRGVAGIDAMITENEVFPIIEINGRFTLSTYVSFALQKLGVENRVAAFQYYRMHSEDEIGFSKILRIFEKNKILYERKTQKGIIILNGCALPKKRSATSKNCLGRLFTFTVAEKESELIFYEKKIREVLYGILA